MDEIEVVQDINGVEQFDMLKGTKMKKNKQHLTKPLVYTIKEKPPFCLSLMLAIQNVVTTIAGALIVINILAPKLCILPEDPAQAYLLSTTILMAGTSTLIQTILGIRLPITQNSGFVYMICSLYILDMPKWQCSNEGDLYSMGPEARTLEWQLRIRDLQGTIIIISIIQMLLGYSGIIGKLMNYIGPLTIVPTMCIVALTVVEKGVHLISGNWTTSLVTLFFLTLFSQYLRDITISIPILSKVEGLVYKKLKIFSLFSVLFSVGIMWIACIYMTSKNELSPTDPANTESKYGVFYNAQLFRIPYPFQWGLPLFNYKSIIAMLPALFASIVESIGTYNTCARFANTSLPPSSAISRGIGVQGVNSILAGLTGMGTGVSASSENVGHNGISQVCSRIIIQYAAMILILIAPFTRLIAFLITLPDPVLGALMSVLLAMVAAVGLSNLQFINLNSMRNLYILGISMFFGLALPKYIVLHDHLVLSKYDFLNQPLLVFMSSGMFIGGIIGFILDNTIPDDSMSKFKTNTYFINEDEKRYNDISNLENEKMYDISEKLIERINNVLTFFV
ncbi:solute carrier family 23 member 1-like isoform X2 [Daktulosphaira vitifoliae]|uniref:solute carrier family 23 member 1-like isoform X2 n=1 Tax=Daktulosphaira vitifoliae TaxID=58002 RepID=UPI0021AA0307|nr:solute carrier family 23 member 1-like isoform X2 [Daktulosphaira vitifoliae]